MIALLAVEAFIGLHVVAAMLIGRHKYGSVRQWWKGE